MRYTPEQRDAMSKRAEKAQAAKRRRLRAAEGYVYVIRFSSGTVKVGETTRPKGRLTDHKRSAAVHDIDIDRVWTSKKHPGYHDTEQKLIDFCEWLGTPVPGVAEYFKDIDAYEFGGLCAFGQLTVDNVLRKALIAKLAKAVDGDMDATVGQALTALGAAA